MVPIILVGPFEWRKQVERCTYGYLTRRPIHASSLEEHCFRGLRNAIVVFPSKEALSFARKSPQGYILDPRNKITCMIWELP